MDIPAQHLQPVPQFAENQPLRPFFEKLIDKQVQGIALSIFEKFVNFICSYVYPTYYKCLRNCIQQRLDNLFLEELQKYPKCMPGREYKIQRAGKEVTIIDQTWAQKVAIRSDEKGENRIWIENYPVDFIENDYTKIEVEDRHIGFFDQIPKELPPPTSAIIKGIKENNEEQRWALFNTKNANLPFGYVRKRN